MAEKALLQIKEAETQAQDLIKKAREEAAHIIERAEKETEDVFSRVSETCRHQALEKKQQAEANAQAKSAEFTKETVAVCAELKQRLSAQKSKAIDSVIQIITE